MNFPLTHVSHSHSSPLSHLVTSCGLLAVSPLAACPRVSTTSVSETPRVCIVSILRASGELPYHPACHSPPCRDVKLYPWTSRDAMRHYRSSIRCRHLFVVECVFPVSHCPSLLFFPFEFASGKWHRERGIECGKDASDPVFGEVLRRHLRVQVRAS